MTEAAEMRAALRSRDDWREAVAAAKVFLEARGDHAPGGAFRLVWAEDDLREKTRRLRLGFNVLCHLEEHAPEIGLSLAERLVLETTAEPLREKMKSLGELFAQRLGPDLNKVLENLARPFERMNRIAETIQTKARRVSIAFARARLQAEAVARARLEELRARGRFCRQRARAIRRELRRKARTFSPSLLDPRVALAAFGRWIRGPAEARVVVALRRAPNLAPLFALPGRATFQKAAAAHFRPVGVVV